MQIIDTQHGFTLSERYLLFSDFKKKPILNKCLKYYHCNRNGVPVATVRINVGQNEISHTYSSTPARSPKLYWSLPPSFTGNKVTSYGGQLSITQRYDERQGSSGQRFSDSDVIITSDRISLVWINPNQLQPGQTVVT